MSVREEFDEWAADGRDKGMEERHWHTAKYALARIPVEPGDTVLDLGTGSGYALRALREVRGREASTSRTRAGSDTARERGVGRAYGLDGSPAMARNARSYTDDPDVGFVVGDFGALPFADDSMDHVFSMEAFYYAADPHETLREVRRVLRPGGTFYCAVNYYEENVHSHDWQSSIAVQMTRWSRAEYRRAFRDAGLYVAGQDTIPDREVEIPPASEFPTDDWEAREDMVDRYRTWGTLLTVGVAP